MGCNNSKAATTTHSTQCEAETQTRRGSFGFFMDASISPGGQANQNWQSDLLRSDASILSQLRQRPPIHRIVLTGGPCAGKSTILSALQTKLPQRTGIKVFCVPEAATLLMNGGLTWDDMTEEKVIEYQLALLQTQLALEDNFYRIALATGQPCLVISDRGTMDGRAYASDAQFKEIMKRGGYTMETLRDERYDAVVHMVTAAIGAEKFYNYDNPVRYETVEEAKTSDEKLRKMYIGHPQLRVFDNSTSFDQKIDRVMDFVCDVIGCKHTYHRVRRYLVTDIPTEEQIPVDFVRVTVTHTVLNHSCDDKVMMLMKRQQGEACVYFYQCIKRLHHGNGGKTPSNNHSPHRHADPNSGNTPNEDGCGGDSAESSHKHLPEADLLECTMNSSSLNNGLRQDVMREEHRISAREYSSLLSQRDPTRVDVVKDNLSFVYGEHYIELARFRQPEWHIGKAVMYVDCERDDPSLPPFVPVAEDMSDMNQYSAYRASVKPKE